MRNSLLTQKIQESEGGEIDWWEGEWESGKARHQTLRLPLMMDRSMRIILSIVWIFCSPGDDGSVNEDDLDGLDHFCSPVHSPGDDGSVNEDDLVKSMVLIFFCPGSSQKLTSRDLTQFAHHVARGMEYLSSKKVTFNSDWFQI